MCTVRNGLGLFQALRKSNSTWVPFELTFVLIWGTWSSEPQGETWVQLLLYISRNWFVAFTMHIHYLKSKWHFLCFYFFICGKYSFCQWYFLSFYICFILSIAIFILLFLSCFHYSFSSFCPPHTSFLPLFPPAVSFLSWHFLHYLHTNQVRENVLEVSKCILSDELKAKCNLGTTCRHINEKSSRELCFLLGN